MIMPNLSSPKTWAFTGIAIAGLAGGAWGLWGRNGADANTVRLPKELSMETLKAQADEPGKLMGTMREAMRREDLTDEQRRQLGQNMHGIMQEMMRERVDEYYNAPEDEKDAVLDKHIEEFQARMKDWESRRKEWEKEQAETDKDKKPEDRESPWRRAFGGQSQQERKAQSESRNPDQMARGMAYFAAMQKRAGERGIKLPQWGPGRGGRGPRNGGP